MNTPLADPPNKLQIWELGRRKNWGQLGEWLRRTRIEEVTVSCKDAEAHMASMRQRIETTKDRGTEQNLILALLSCGQAEHGHQLLKRIFALGVSPDGVDKSRYSAVDLARRGEHHKCLEVLRMCRARGAVDVILPNALETAKTSGSPSVAELVSRKEYWAAKNVCRRRLISQSEASGTFEGRNAVQWAESHGEEELAAELRYFLFYVRNSILRPAAVTSGTRSQASPPGKTPGVASRPKSPYTAAVYGQPKERLSEVRALEGCFTTYQEVVKKDVAELGRQLETQASGMESRESTLDSEETELQQMKEMVVVLAERICVAEEKLKSGNPSTSEGSEKPKSGTSPRRALISEYLQELGDIADSDPSDDLLRDLIDLVQKHKKRRTV